jgi:6-phosphogluconolactonase (cycloisomerase 2 family)
MDRFLFVTDVGGNQVSSFVLSNGSLTASAAPASTGQHPFGVALDPSSSFLFVANKVDNTISVFSVNANTGALTAVSGSPFAAGGAGPTGIVLVPADNMMMPMM